MDSLAYRNAQKHVSSYSEESHDVMQQHAEAMNCRNCEAFLQMGIDAFEWLIRADREARTEIYRGEKPFDEAAERQMSELCQRWLEVSDLAEKQIEAQQARGLEIDNLAEFRECVRQMSAIVKSDAQHDNRLPKQIATYRDSAIQEHDNGETAEFV